MDQHPKVSRAVRRFAILFAIVVSAGLGTLSRACAADGVSLPNPVVDSPRP